MNTIELSEAAKAANRNSHRWGVIDDCYRCIDCEIGVWNGWRENCNA